MPTNKVLVLMGKLISGLNVPLSLSLIKGVSNFLGTAQQPLLDLREELGLFGYLDAEEVTEILKTFFKERDDN